MFIFILGHDKKVPYYTINEFRQDAIMLWKKKAIKVGEIIDSRFHRRLSIPCKRLSPQRDN